MRHSPVGDVLLASLLWLGPAARAQGIVAARVWNPDAVVDARLLRSAETIVDELYERAGVTLDWRHCGAESDPASDCAGPQGPNDVAIRFVDHRVEGRSLAEDLYGGRAVPLRRWAGSGFAYVYTDRVRQVSGDGCIPERIVLGAILAHEIGHLLLPGGHSAGGVMRARLEAPEWRLAERGWLRFTRAQLALLRACVQRAAAVQGRSAPPPATLAFGAVRELLP